MDGDEHSDSFEDDMKFEESIDVVVNEITFENEQLQKMRNDAASIRKTLIQLHGDNTTKFLYQTTPRYIASMDFKVDEIMMERMCNFGITWYYWSYYKNSCMDIPDSWSVGLSFGDLYVEPHYHTLKLELI